MRDAALEVLRHHGLTTLFANPGSTEVPFLVDLPPDLEFVLALHEGSVIGLATGWALARGEPALALLHTTAGLGNAVGALATARVNRAPLVVLVGQQDRRHLAAEPFLAGRLEGLAGSYPVSVAQPLRPQDVPTAIARASHAARDGRGPALVIVPMDDWLAPAAREPVSAPLATAVSRAAADVDAVATLLDDARSPVLVAGAGNDSADGWEALAALAERLGCLVWQEPFSARAGFPWDHERFAGHLPPGRAALRAALAPHDVVLVVGAPLLRQYGYEPGPLLEPGTRAAVISDDADEVRRSPVEVGLVADPATACRALAERVEPREDRHAASAPREDRHAASAPREVRGDGSWSARAVLAALGARVPPETIVVEEAPSSRADLLAALPARRPLGFLSAAMGGLGFAVPAAAGLRLADPSRPVVAVVGDGSALYGIHGLWSAARYGAGALFVVLSNGRYAIMDQLARDRGPWPGFDEVDVAGLAASFGCPARRIETAEELGAVLDEVVPGLAGRREPLVLDVRVDRRAAG